MKEIIILQAQWASHHPLLLPDPKENTYKDVKISPKMWIIERQECPISNNKTAGQTMGFHSLFHKQSRGMSPCTSQDVQQMGQIWSTHNVIRFSQTNNNQSGHFAHIIADWAIVEVLLEFCNPYCYGKHQISTLHIFGQTLVSPSQISKCICFKNN